VRRTILVVDDQPSMCWILTKILSREGYQVKTTATGSSALAIVETDEVHAAIVDYRLPDMTGIELFQRMMKKRRRIPAVLITSYGSEQLRAEALRLGFHAYLDKPLDNRVLIATLRAVLKETASRDGAEP